MHRYKLPKYDTISLYDRRKLHTIILQKRGKIASFQNYLRNKIVNLLRRRIFEWKYDSSQNSENHVIFDIFLGGRVGNDELRKKKVFAKHLHFQLYPSYTTQTNVAVRGQKHFLSIDFFPVFPKRERSLNWFSKYQFNSKYFCKNWSLCNAHWFRPRSNCSKIRKNENAKKELCSIFSCRL